VTKVLLIYPFFKPAIDRSVFRFPPLGISTIASSLQKAGHYVNLLDCTFLKKEQALENALAVKTEVTGIYCMATMMKEALWFADQLRSSNRLLIAGGPLPTCDPLPFLISFDIVVKGEGEQTIVEILQAFKDRSSFDPIPGIVYRKETFTDNSKKESLISTPDRPFEKNLDILPFPARELLPNKSYIRHGKKKSGYSITTVMSTRGCPYQCEFCSNVVFGGSYRERSPQNVVDEIEEALEFGYDRISFADDVFTLNRERVMRICDEIKHRNLHFAWECLGRVDSMDYETAKTMKDAGCARIYFGIESGSDVILQIMKKNISAEQARKAVEVIHQAGIQVGAFFILFYPGDTDDTVLETLHFIDSLPLDYLGLTMPYPLPGTALYDRVKDRINRDWHPEENPFFSHMLIFDSDFSELKIRFGLLKGRIQFEIKRRLGKAAPLILKLFGYPTDALLRFLK
jgi:anaerobic magnesium-protoporphyrin IX monomethyl ester cyclase